MAGILIRMKLALLRNSISGDRAIWMGVGAFAGLGLAAATIWLSTLDLANPTVLPDLLAAVYLMWALGWVGGITWSGGADLRATHFSLLGLPRRRLAVALVATAFVGIGAVVTFAGFSSLVVYAARLGPAALAVAVPAALVQLVLVVLLSKVAAIGFGRVARSRPGAALTGVVTSIIIVLAQSGWMLAVAVQVTGVLGSGFPSWFTTTVRALPSGWAVVAVGAADDGRWGLVAAALAGLVALIVVLLLVFSRGLGDPGRERGTIRGTSLVAPGEGGATSAGLRKELRTWWRDPARVQALTVPVAWAVGTSTLPLTFGTKILLPWAGPQLALMAASAAVNLYGQDGTALWLTLLTGSQRSDLRARQWAYLIILGPVTVAVAVGFVIWSGMSWTWPWVLGLTPALLGGGLGLASLLSVLALVPGPDPHKRSGNPLEGANTVGLTNIVFWVGLLTAVPPGALLGLGTYYHDDRLLWAAVPVGVLTGIGLAWGLGRAAIGQLRGRGPELLFLMRTGRPTRPPVTAVRITGTRAILLGLGVAASAIAIVPQGIIPVAFRLAHLDVKVWFLAMYLPTPTAWVVSAAFIIVGFALLYVITKTFPRIR